MNDIDNPIASKIQELMGYDIKNMALSVKSTLPFLTRWLNKFKIISRKSKINFFFIKQTTNLNGTISLIVERSPNNIKNASINISENLQKTQELCSQLADSVGKSTPITTFATIAFALALSIPQVRVGALVVAADLSAPLDYLFLRPVY